MPCDRTPDEKKKLKGHRDADKPRRKRQNDQPLDSKPPNAWLRFRSTLNDRFPNHKTSQSSAASELWSKLTAEEKEPYFRQAADDMLAWKARKIERERIRAQSQLAVSSSPSSSPIPGPSSPTGGSEESYPSSSIMIWATPSPEHSTTHGTVSDNGSTSVSPSSYLSSPSRSRHRLPGIIRSPLRGPGASGGGRGMGGGLPAQASMGRNGIFQQRPYGAIDPGSAMRYPATSSAQAGPSGYGRHFPGYRNANANMNAYLPTFTAHSAPAPSPSGLHSAVDPLVGGSDSEIDWSAILSMGQPSLPPTGPSQYPNHYRPQFRSGSGSISHSSNVNANTMRLSELTPSTSASSGQHSTDWLVGGTRRDAEIDWSLILNMPSVARTPAGPTQLPSNYLSQSGSGSGSGSRSSNANANPMGLSGLPAPISFVPAPDQPRSGSSYASAMGLSGLMADTPFVPTPHQHQHLQQVPNSAPNMPLSLGLGPFDSPTRTSGGSSHSTTPSSDVNLNGDGDHAHAAQGPSLWDMPFSLDDVVPPLPPLEDPDLDLGIGRQEHSEGKEGNADGFGFDFDFVG